MSTGKVILGVVAGAAVGALVGILYAPARGSVTRRSIYRKGEHEVDGLKDKFSDFVDSITEKFEKRLKKNKKLLKSKCWLGSH